MSLKTIVWVWGRAELGQVIRKADKMPRHGSDQPKVWRNIGQGFCRVDGWLDDEVTRLAEAFALTQ